LSLLIALADFIAEQPIEAAGHQSQLQVTGDFHGNGRGECVHVEEVNAILKAILDDHAACVALDEFAGGAGQLIGEQKSWLIVPEILDHNLANGFLVASQMDSLVEQTRVTIDPGNPFQMGLHGRICGSEWHTGGGGLHEPPSDKSAKWPAGCRE